MIRQDSVEGQASRTDERYLYFAYQIKFHWEALDEFHIEVTGTDDILFLVFFDQPFAGDIGYTGTFSAFTKEVLAATFQCAINQLPNAPFYPADLLIVHRLNPVAP